MTIQAVAEQFKWIFIYPEQEIATLNEVRFPEKTPISLIDGKRFIEIFTEQYDKVMDLLLEEDQEELAGKIKFRKGLWPE